MRGAILAAWCFVGSLAVADLFAQVPNGSTAQEGYDAEDPCPHVKFNQPPTLPPVAPRMGGDSFLPRPTNPRAIYFDPYFIPTHYNFRPFAYGVAPTTPDFFYGAFANPYYYQFYGPGEYYGF